MLAWFAAAALLAPSGGCDDARPLATEIAPAPATIDAALANASGSASPEHARGAPTAADRANAPSSRSPHPPVDLMLPSLMAYPPPPPRDGTAGATSPSSAAGVVDAAAPSGAGAAPQAAACAGIVQRDGDRLVLGGQPVAFFGINAHYLLDPEFPEERVTYFLGELAKREVNTVRIWFFDDEDPDRLERLLDAGRQRGLKFVVTLADHVFKDVDWFGGDEDERRYRPHLARTIERFKDRPEILMWELINEPSCGAGNYSAECAERIKGWLRSRAREAAAIDGCHLVSTGMIGAGNYDEERDEFRRIHREDAIQIVSAHRRTDERRDVTMAIAAELDRPVFYGEIYDAAYDEGCRALEGSASPRERARRVLDDLEDSLDDGVDGYLLWALAVGRIQTDDGERYYCGVNDYELDDPLWSRLADDPSLPPPVPWGPEP